MSDIGLLMNGFLAVLLMGALAMGWRLERRLKALRASHASFAKAVEDLDRAAARAEQGLADLRAATDEAAESLAGRIDRADNLAARLEKLTSEATNVEARMALSQRPAPRASAPPPVAAQTPARADPERLGAVRDGAFSRFTERYGATIQPQSRPAPARTDLIIEDEPARSPAASRLQALRERLQPKARVSAPARADDELFDAAPRRAAGGAR